MRIAVFTPDYPPNLFGGIGTFVFNLYKNMQHDEITIFHIPLLRTVEESAPHSSYDVVLWNYPDLKYEGKEDFLAYITAYNERIIKSFDQYVQSTGKKFDALHLHASCYAFSLPALKAKYGMKILYTMHGIAAHMRDPYYIMDITMFNNVDISIAPSNWMANRARQQYPEIPMQIQTIYNGVDIQPNDGMKKKERSILFCGRLTRKKGCDLLLSAVARLRDVLAQEGYRIDIVGDGPYREDLERLVKTLRVEDMVVFHGFLSAEATQKFMHQAEICVVPSQNEAFGLVAVEAMSCMCCPIVCNSGGLAEIVVPNASGMVFEAGNDEDLAQKIHDVIFNVELRNNLSLGAFERSMDFSWSVVAAEYTKLYSEI